MSPLPRRVEPEQLDSLPHEDPRAARGRRDLRRVNWLMGNHRWIEAEVAARSDLARGGIVEIGAGDGRLLARLARYGPARGCDLSPRPSDLPESADWEQGDLFAAPRGLSGGILVANLFLHHLLPGELRRLGGVADCFDLLLFAEPHRSRRALALSAPLLPLVGEVTRHDMPTSIRAGFLPGEIPALLGLSPRWRVTEKPTLRGGLRVSAMRQP